MRNLLRNLILSFSYFIGVGIVLLLFLKFNGNLNLINRNSFLNWDAAHYLDIAQNGYSGSQFAFFPLFPLFWRIIGLGIFPIIAFNGILFILSGSLLATVFEFPAKHYLLMLTFPSIIFMFLPYSEALFFFGCVLSLVGIKKQRHQIGFAGMVVASLARPVIYLFLPALVIIMLLVKKRGDTRRLFIYLLGALLGLATVIILQFMLTHDWLAFFHSQQGWGNNLRLPHFHLSTWGGDNIVMLDATAFLTGIASTFMLVRMFLRRKHINFDIPFLFSILYLAGICWIVLFTRGGMLFSLNRFVFATPFFFIAFSVLLKYKCTLKEYILIFLLLNAFWLLFGSYVHIQQVLRYLLLTIYLICIVLITNPKKIISHLAFCIIMLGDIFLQVYFYLRFLNGGWLA